MTMRQAVFVVALAFVACAWSCEAVDTSAPHILELPHSTGGVRTALLNSAGTQAWFTNDTGTIFAVDWENMTVMGEATIDSAQYGIIYYAFLSASESAMYISTSGSYLLRVDLESMSLSDVLDVSDHLKPGWGGGYAISLIEDAVFMTGNYSVVKVALGTQMAYQDTYALKTGDQAYEPLCGDMSVMQRHVFFGSATGNRTHGLGGLTSMDVDTQLLEQYFIPLGPDMHWPFQVIAGAKGEYVYVFASDAIGVVDLSLGKVLPVRVWREVQCTSGGNACWMHVMCVWRDRECVQLVTTVAVEHQMHELMCFNAQKTYVNRSHRLECVYAGTVLCWRLKGCIVLCCVRVQRVCFTALPSSVLSKAAGKCGAWMAAK